MKRFIANLLRRVASRLDPADWVDIERQAQQALDAFYPSEAPASSRGDKNG